MVNIHYFILYLNTFFYFSVYKLIIWKMHDMSLYSYNAIISISCRVFYKFRSSSLFSWALFNSCNFITFCRCKASERIWRANSFYWNKLVSNTAAHSTSVTLLMFAFVCKNIPLFDALPLAVTDMSFVSTRLTILETLLTNFLYTQTV